MYHFTIEIQSNQLQIDAITKANQMIARAWFSSKYGVLGGAFAKMSSMIGALGTYQLLEEWHSCWQLIQQRSLQRTSRRLHLAPFYCWQFWGRTRNRWGAKRDGIWHLLVKFLQVPRLCTILRLVLVCLQLYSWGLQVHFSLLLCLRDVP